MNRAFINRQGRLEVIYEGAQTTKSIGLLDKTVRRLASKLTNQGHPVNILVDIDRITTVDAAARRQSFVSFKKSQFDALAIYGSNRFFQLVTQLAIRAVDQEGRVATFRSRPEAETWLDRQSLAKAQTAPRQRKTKSLDNYQQHVDAKLAELRDVLSLATIGEYSKDLPIPDDDDEFLDIFVGIRLLIETIRERKSLRR